MTILEAQRLLIDIPVVDVSVQIGLYCQPGRHRRCSHKRISGCAEVEKSTQKNSGTAISKNNIEMSSTSAKGATSKNTSKKNKAVHAQNTDAA